MGLNNSLPRIGVLGGMGPLASAEFVVKLVHATAAGSDDEHFPVTLDSSPQIPRPAQALHGGPDPLPAMVQVIGALERANCAFVVMPCNTAHHWYDRLAACTALPILHVADAVAARLRVVAPSARRVALLATRLTSKTELYSERLGNEWEWLYATDDELDELVMPGVAAVKSGDLALARNLFLEAIRRLTTRGPDVIVLACTEISIVVKQADVGAPTIDSTDALAAYTISMARKITSGASAMLPSGVLQSM